MARATKKPYFIKVLNMVIKEFPGYNWSTEVRFQGEEPKRVLTGGKTFESGNTFAMAVELPDKPMMLGKEQYWKAAAKAIIRNIEKADKTYGKKPTEDEGKLPTGTNKKSTSKTGIRSRGKNPS